MNSTLVSFCVGVTAAIYTETLFFMANFNVLHRGIDAGFAMGTSTVCGIAMFMACKFKLL